LIQAAGGWRGGGEVIEVRRISGGVNLEEFHSVSEKFEVRLERRFLASETRVSKLGDDDGCQYRDDDDHDKELYQREALFKGPSDAGCVMHSHLSSTLFQKLSARGEFYFSVLITE
jgi:hypothetical protein